MRRIFLMVLFALATGMAHAGDYNLWMSDDSSDSCAQAPRRGDNTCPPKIIVEDIRSHLVDRKPFKYDAVQLAFDTCRITFSDAGRPQFYDGLIALLVDPGLHEPDKLTAFMSCFNYRSLRSRLKAAMDQAGTETAKARLRAALSSLEAWKK